ncbi:MAG TPA: hypothetical protein VGC85_02515 [Chthoniobacterales bacterium]
MKKEQSRAPILDGIERCHEAAVLPFTTPGHKRDGGVADDPAMFVLDPRDVEDIARP